MIQQPSEAKSLSCKIFRDGAPGAPLASLDDISTVLEDPGVFVWLDGVDPGPNDLDLIREEFNLHPLAIEDAVQAHERPKIESFGHYWFLIVQGVTQHGDSTIFHEMAIFAGQRFLVTVRHEPAFPINEIEERFQADPARLKFGSGFLLYTILDTVVDGYFPVADHIEDHVDELEEVLFQDHPRRTEILPEIFTLKRDAQRFRHAAVPMRDILNPIIRRDLTLFPDEVVVYFRDIYDHAVRIIDQLDTMRDLVNSALEIHLSVVANKNNETSKQLTLVATIFLPLSFVVGFFGQNFSFLVEHIQGLGSFLVLGAGSCLLAVALTLMYFKNKGWF